MRIRLSAAMLRLPLHPGVDDRILTNEEVDARLAKVVERLRSERGAEIRG